MRLVHLSEEDLDGKVLTPRIPKNYLTEQGFEDNKTKRISFAPSEDNALIGMSMNLKGKELYVHEPSDYENLKTQKATGVPDAIHTNEIWALDPVTLKRTGKIKVIEAEEEPLEYEYGPGHKAETYRWKFEPIKEAMDNLNHHMEKIAKDTNYFQDFLGGFDPSGVRTFEAGRNNEEDHRKHQLAGSLGGFTGGALLGTLGPAALIKGSSLAAKKYSPTFAHELDLMAKGTMDALNPMAMKRYMQSLPEFMRFSEKGADVLKDSREVSQNLQKIYQGADVSPEQVKETAKAGKRIFNTQQEMEDIGKDLSSKYYKGKSPVEGGSRAMTALTTAGAGVLGGITEGYSSHKQYNQGKRIQEEEKGLGKKASEEAESYRLRTPIGGGLIGLAAGGSLAEMKGKSVPVGMTIGGLTGAGVFGILEELKRRKLMEQLEKQANTQLQESEQSLMEARQHLQNVLNKRNELNGGISYGSLAGSLGLSALGSELGHKAGVQSKGRLNPKWTSPTGMVAGALAGASLGGQFDQMRRERKVQNYQKELQSALQNYNERLALNKEASFNPFRNYWDVVSGKRMKDVLKQMEELNRGSKEKEQLFDEVVKTKGSVIEREIDQALDRYNRGEIPKEELSKVIQEAETIGENIYESRRSRAFNNMMENTQQFIDKGDEYLKEKDRRNKYIGGTFGTALGIPIGVKTGLHIVNKMEENEEETNNG